MGVQPAPGMFAGPQPQRGVQVLPMQDGDFVPSMPSLVYFWFSLCNLQPIMLVRALAFFCFCFVRSNCDGCHGLKTHIPILNRVNLEIAQVYLCPQAKSAWMVDMLMLSVMLSAH